MGWIRWNYVIKRLLLLVVLFLLAEYASGPIVRWALIASGERSIGADVAIDTAETSLLRSNLRLTGIQVANPKSPYKNLFETDEISLDLDMASLLRKKAVAEHGVVRGLKFATSRETSGEIPALDLESPSSEDDNFLSNQAIDTARDWFANLSGQFTQDLASQFESVRLTQELVARWPQKYAKIEARIEALKQSATEIQEKIKVAQTNPLRHVGFLENLPRELKGLENSFRQMHAEIAAMPEMAQQDRIAIEAARQSDEALIREKLHIDTIDSAALTAYLLRERLAGPLADVIEWIRWARNSSAIDQAVAKRNAPRGINILFPGCAQRPDLLIRSLELYGSTRLGGQPVEISGTITDLTSDPALHGEPTRLEITATGSLPMRIQAIIDRTGDMPRDQLLVDCDGLMLPGYLLGKRDTLSLALAPSSASLNISVVLEGDRLMGDVQLVQKSVQITPSVGARFAEWDLEDPLRETLGELKSIATHVTLAGTLDEPTWEIWSNLGPAASQAMKLAIASAIESKSQDLLARSSDQISQQMQMLDSLMVERGAALTAQMDSPQKHVQQIAQTYLGENGLALEFLGRRLPKNSILR